MTFQTDNMPAFVVTIIITVLMGTMAGGIIFAPVFAIVRGVHDKWRWNIAWWKRPVLTLWQWSQWMLLLFAGGVLMTAFSTATLLPIPIVAAGLGIILALCTLAVYFQDFKIMFIMLETAYLLDPQEVQKWWKTKNPKLTVQED